MYFIKRALKKDYTVINYTYPSRSKTIKAHGRDLALFIRQIVKKSPNQPIHFVTHSLGGVVLLAALNDPNCPNEAKRGKAVLIAPPLRGSKLARMMKSLGPMKQLMGKNAGKELMEENDFSHLGLFPKDVSLLVIAGRYNYNPLISESNDGRVTISETKPYQPHAFRIVNAEHSWISLSKDTIKHTKKFLAR